ncbi:MAG: GNAT family N-acetyltransferase [archaeon]
MNQKTKPLVDYRLATIKDLDTVALFGKELIDSHKKYGWYYEFKKDYSKIIKKEFEGAIKSKRSFILVAETKGKLIGCALVNIYDKPQESIPIYKWGLEAELVELYVKKGHREHKIGENLLAKSAELAKKRGCEMLMLIIDRKNRRAAKFYKKEGLDFYDEVYVRRLK